MGASTRQDGTGLSFLIARALILWDRRLDRGVVSGAELDGIRQRFAADLYARFRSESSRLSQTTIEWAFDWYIENNRTLVDWYTSLRVLEDGGRMIRWSDGQPTIRFAGIDRWERLCNHFDPDMLMALDLACRRQRKCDASTMVRSVEVEREFPHWSTVVRIENRFIDGVGWGKDLSDLHIHVSGIRLPQAAWHELLFDEVRPKTFSNLNRIYRSSGLELDDEIHRARTFYRMLTAQAREHFGDNPSARANRDLKPSTTKWWRWSCDVLMTERQVLADIWSILIAERGNADLSRLFDQYLSLKNRFFQTVRQGAFPTEPGLRNFELNYFSALKRSIPRERWHRQSLMGEVSPRLAMSPFGDACRFLMESQPLQRVELRISPFETANDYLRFFKSWRKLRERLEQADEGRSRDFRFAVHFRRSLKRKGGGGDVVPDEAVKLRMLDRSTAALQLALNVDAHNEPDRQYMRALGRIDIAGQERDSPAALFASYLRLLRGDTVALKFLDGLGPDDPRAPWFQRWLQLRQREQHEPAATRQLGLTVHAGEDFANLLDGLYQVAMALDAYGLGEGDGVGHGMALATLPEDPWITPDEYAIMPVGQVLDSLCWLKHLSWSMVPSFGRNEFFGEVSELDRLIVKMGGLSGYPASVDVNDYVWAWRHGVGPYELPNEAPGRARELFAFRWGEPGMHARGQIRPLTIRLAGIRSLVLQAQQMLLQQVIERKVVIEFNPSSNVRTTGVDVVRDVPTIRLFELVRKGLRACINTDNPSVFVTRIENEYSLLYKGAADAGIARADIEELLETVRAAGMSKEIVP